MISTWQRVVIVLFLLILTPIIYSIYDILRSDFKGNNKIIWLIVVIFLPVIGSLFYLLMGRFQNIVQE